MDHSVSVCFLVVLALTSSRGDPQTSRWSRQISGFTSDFSDWVPLTRPIERPDQPIKRQAVAQPRILSEPFQGFSRPTGFSQDFQSPGFFQGSQQRPLFLQSVPTASQNFLNDQGFGQPGIKLALGTPNFPLSQGFVANSQGFNRFPQSPVKFEQLSKPIPPPAAPKFSQQQTIPMFVPQSPTVPKFLQQSQIPQKIANRPEGQKFIDGYRLENASNDFNFGKQKPQSLQKLKFDAPAQFGTFQKQPVGQPRPTNVEREEVQLLYVPVDSINRGQINYKTIPNSNRDLFGSPAVQRPESISQSFGKPQRAQPAFPSLSQDFFSTYNNQKFGVQTSPQITFGTSPTTPFSAFSTTVKPKKLKPHQPPLAVFLAHENTKPGSIKVADVLLTLKSARNIAVLDSVSPAHSPKVFIGPSSLNPPEKYVKFELPYLSNLENTDKKLRQLPFFVAPLSYNTPDGFAKIPFPSPHVGSVIVNSLLKDSNQFGTSTPMAHVIPNSYTGQTNSAENEGAVTTKPTISYFSTSAPTTPPQRNQFQTNYFSFEPQSVTPIKPSREPEPNIITAQPLTPPSSIRPFFQSFNQPPLFRPHGQQNQGQVTSQTPEASSFGQSDHFQHKLNFDHNQNISPTQPPSTKLTSKAPATFPNVLLETHNPFSINQAFDFSSPLDYHSNLDESKRDFVTPSFGTPTPKTKQELTTVKQILQSSPNYLQNYSPEIHYQSEILSSRFPNFDSNSYRSTESSADIQTQNQQNPTADFSPEKINQDQMPVSNPDYIQTSVASTEYATRPPNDDINKVTASNVVEEVPSTTTRRPTRGRGRPRSTTPRTESDQNTRPPVTRRPLRERRPIAPRARPSTERPAPARRQPEVSTATESSAQKTTRLRTRGRLHYKPTEHPDEAYELNKNANSKTKPEDDIAYQRDVLHQNYPVTIQERVSTADIDDVTSPSPKISSTRILQTETPSSEVPFVTEQSPRSTFDRSPIKEVEPPTFTPRTSVQTEQPYVPRFSATINEEPSYNTRSSTRQQEETIFERPSSPKYDPNLYVPRSSTSQIRTESIETVSPTEATRSSTYSSRYSDTDLREKQTPVEEEEVTTVSSYESSKVSNRVQLSENNNLNDEQSPQQEEINTLPPQLASRPKIRNRPLPTRQQTSTTESTSNPAAVSQKSTRLEVKRRPVGAVTYRPAFNRRTTMRIEEIEAELKTKEIHSRPDNIERHPVYRPESTTLPTTSTSSLKKSNQYRRKRPQSSFSSSTTTESSIVAKKPTYETKNRFRGRRPTSERPIQNSQEDTTIASNQKPQFNRFNHRSRIPERYNRKQTTTETPALDDEQNADASIHRPKIVSFDGKSEENWAPDSFKPFNPNDILDPSQGDIQYRSKDINASAEEPEIVTARNDYDDEEILLTVTPASNRLNQRIPEIPPTLEAFVEQSKGSATAEGSSIESVIEEMMKSLEEQDEDEYTRNVMKHEHGEIGEIPPEKVIATVDTTERKQNDNVPDALQESPKTNEETGEKKQRRRGYWKKVRVRPVTTESFEVAESQFYSKTVNHLGDEVKPTKVHSIEQDIPISEEGINSQESVESSDPTTILPEIPEAVEVPKGLSEDKELLDPGFENTESTKVYKLDSETTEDPINPGDMDLGTGSPDSTVMDIIYTTTTEGSNGLSILGSAGGSIMDYLFGFSSSDKNEEELAEKEEVQTNETKIFTTQKLKEPTTESSFIPSEITENSEEENATDNFESVKEVETEKSTVTEVAKEGDTSSESSWDPSAVVSTSMSTEVSHETEICYRGKCIKTSKDFV